MLKFNIAMGVLYLLCALALYQNVNNAMEASYVVSALFVCVNFVAILTQIYARYLRFSCFSKAMVAVNEAFFLCILQSNGYDKLPAKVKLDARDILRDGVLPVQRYTKRDLVELVEYADARIDDIRSAATYFTQLLSEIREAKNE
jgi:hypothetical protein